MRNGRAVGVILTDGTEIDARSAIIADVSAPKLFFDLVGSQNLPASFLAGLKRFQTGHAVFKLDWALDAPIPWKSEVAGPVGTLHLGDGMDHLSRYSAQLATSAVPDKPFVLLGQMTTTDSSRSPAGTETAWAYTHVPIAIKEDAAGEVKGNWDRADTHAMVNRIEAEVEARAPGFKSLIAGRLAASPRDLEAENANLVGGTIDGGTAYLHQQLAFRFVVGGRSKTPIKGLFLGSASAHSGGGVHGACGANAAHAAMRHQRRK